MLNANHRILPWQHDWRGCDWGGTLWSFQWELLRRISPLIGHCGSDILSHPLQWRQRSITLPFLRGSLMQLWFQTLEWRVQHFLFLADIGLLHPNTSVWVGVLQSEHVLGSSLCDWGLIEQMLPLELMFKEEEFMFSMDSSLWFSLESSGWVKSFFCDLLYCDLSFISECFIVLVERFCHMLWNLKILIIALRN